MVHPSVSVILCTNFNSSDDEVALCEEAVELLSTDSESTSFTDDLLCVQPIILIGSF